ncbi:transglycosylase domain-containing protein [Pilimelia columellifera]|uniref:transglycosylase domain-containing protein n=1 Tax=Pilimelia columellifera TaxID=706574 RepID=UPI0031CF8F95
MSSFAALAVCGVLTGLVVAAAAFPGAAMSGLAVKAGAETFAKLPSELIVKQAPQITYVYANDGRTPLATLYDENRSDTRLDQIAPVMRQAIIAAEDHQFYEHNGVDPRGIARALVATGSGGDQQGGSTLTMQYVRQAISYSAEKPADVVAATEDTPARKLREVRYAVSLERELSKDEILERYLNIAPFGNGTYGVFAASRVYFGKHPKDLTIDQAAMLAGMVKAPSAFDPNTPTGYPQAVARRDYVIGQMVETGAITPAQATTAKAAPLKVGNKRTPNGCVSTPKNDWGFFCDYLYRWWMEQEEFGETAYDRERALNSQGYKIITTLDPKIQSSAKRAVERHLPTGNRHALMIAAVEPGTGRVRAMATNRNYSLDQSKNKPSTNPDKRRLKMKGTYPNTTNPLITGGGDIAGYQAGSTFKMFTAVAALEKGMPLATSYRAPGQIRTNYVVEYGSPSACRGTNRWCPKNADPSMNGVRTMWTGFGRSVNTYFVKLEEQVGADRAVRAAEKLGIRFRAANDQYYSQNARTWGAFTLGVSLTTPLEVANAYATLAAEGKYCEPIPVQEIRKGDQALKVANPRCEQVVKTEVARAAIDMARCPVGDRSATTRCDSGTFSSGRGLVGKPVAGKTGTTDGNKTANLVLTSKKLAVAGTMADPDWANTYAEMSSNVVNYAVGEALRDGLQGIESPNFTAPDGGLVNGEQRRIPSVTCTPIETAMSRIRVAGFSPELGRRVESRCPTGTAAGTDPEWRTIKGGPVVIDISNGRKPQPDADRQIPTDPDGLLPGETAVPRRDEFPG